MFYQNYEREGLARTSAWRAKETQLVVVVMLSSLRSGDASNGRCPSSGRDPAAQGCPSPLAEPLQLSCCLQGRNPNKAHQQSIFPAASTKVLEYMIYSRHT